MLALNSANLSACFFAKQEQVGSKKLYLPMVIYKANKSQLNPKKIGDIKKTVKQDLTVLSVVKQYFPSIF